MDQADTAVLRSKARSIAEVSAAVTAARAALLAAAELAQVVRATPADHSVAALD